METGCRKRKFNGGLYECRVGTRDMVISSLFLQEYRLVLLSMDVLIRSFYSAFTTFNSAGSTRENEEAKIVNLSSQSKDLNIWVSDP